VVVVVVVVVQERGRREAGGRAGVWLIITLTHLPNVECRWLAEASHRGVPQPTLPQDSPSRQH
jgi:hypothetical protein